jgi:hypothetical protein
VIGIETDGARARRFEELFKSPSQKEFRDYLKLHREAIISDKGILEHIVKGTALEDLEWIEPDEIKDKLRIGKFLVNIYSLLPPGARKIISSKKPLDDEDYRRLFDVMKDYPVLNLKISRSSCGAKKAISVDFNEGKNPYAADFFITPLKAFE